MKQLCYFFALIKGIPKQPDTLQRSADQQGTSSPLELPPTRLGMSSVSKQQYQQPKHEPELIANEPMEVNVTIDKDEKSERKTIDVDETSTPSKSSAATNLPGPSTSKETSSRQSGSGLNLYMQLKKKTYFDSHESDKRSDGPQDLSCTKPNADAQNARLDDSDFEMADAESDMQSQSYDANQHLLGGESSSSGTTIRPQIIVSPRNASAFIKSTKSDGGDSATLSIVNENSSSSQLSSASSENVGKGGSPSKSVIVRIGSSTMVSLLRLAV